MIKGKSKKEKEREKMGKEVSRDTGASPHLLSKENSPRPSFLLKYLESRNSLLPYSLWNQHVSFL